MTHDLDQIKSRLDLRHVAHDLNLVPKRFASAFSARVRFHCPSPRHPNGDTKGDLSVACDHFVCHSANCGAKGDVFDLLALVHDLDRDAHFSQLLVDAAHRAGVDLPSSSGLIPARSPARPPRPLLKAKGTQATQGACEVRRRILGQIQALVESYPLSPQALAWCQGRGLDPDLVHKEGCRDWSCAQEELLALLGSYSQEELRAAGLFRQNSGGANWVPPLQGGIKRGGLSAQAVAIPVRDAQGEVLTYRFRLLYPRRKGRLKELPAFGSLGPQGMGLGAHALGADIHTLLVCEGVPDYLAAKEAVAHRPGVGVWATCAIAGLAKQLPPLLSGLPAHLSVHLLIHHDQKEQAQGTTTLLSAPVWQALCEREELREVNLRVWEVHGHRDVCDLHACGELAPHLDAILGSEGGKSLWADRTPEFEAMGQAFLNRPAPLPSLLAHTRAHPQAPPTGAEALELGALREAMAARFKEVVEQGGMHAVCAPPGSGKSYAVRQAILEAWERGERVKVVVPTNLLAQEFVRELICQASESFEDPIRRLEFGRSVEFAPKRTPTNCVRLGEVHAGNRVVQQGGKQVCGRCDLHPSNQGDGGKSECGFFARMRASGGGRILITTHELELLTTPWAPPRVCTRIDWTQIRRLEATGARCIPWVTQTEGGLSLGVKEDPHGSLLPPNARPAPLEPWEEALGEDAWELDGEQQQAVLAWFAGHREGCEQTTPEAIRAAYSGAGPDAWLWDVMVIDELPLGAMRQVTSATLLDLNLWRASGDLSVRDDAAWRRVCDAMAQEQGLADAHLHAWLGDTGLSVREGVSQTGIGQLEQALRTDGTRRMEVLGRAPDHRALLALGAAIKRGFVDARIEGERLYVPHVRWFDTSQARCLLYLDATAHPGTICAMFGPQMRRHGFEAKMPAGLRVTQAAWSATKNLVDAHGVMRQELDAKRLGACVAAFDSPDTRWMMHQNWEEVLGHTVRERGSYYGSARARGVNDWKDAHTIVAGAHHVPRAELESCARTLRWMAGERGAEVSQIQWGAAAKWELETAPMIQAVWRIRPLSACPEHPKHIVLLDARELPGLTPTEVVEVEALMVKTNQGVWGKEGWREVVRGVLRASGGVFLPALSMQNLMETPFPPEPPSSSMGVLGGYASLSLTQWQDWANELGGHIEAHWGGWEALAHDLGLGYGRLQTSNPGMPWVVLWDPEVPFELGEVCRRCKEKGLDWIGWGGERIHVGPLWYLDALPHLKQRPTIKSLADFFGLTTRTIRRRLAGQKHTLEDVCRAWEGHQEAQSPEPSAGEGWAWRQLMQAIRDLEQTRRLCPKQLAAKMGLSVAATTDWCRLLGYAHWRGGAEEGWARTRFNACLNEHAT